MLAERVSRAAHKRNGDPQCICGSWDIADNEGEWNGERYWCGDCGEHFGPMTMKREVES